MKAGGLTQRCGLGGALVLVALLARLALWPLATLSSGDSATRVLIAWAWLEEPAAVLPGFWGPLHFYLIAAALALWPDTLRAPVALQILLTSAAGAALFGFIRREMPIRSEITAFAAAAAFALSPLFLSRSLEARSEPLAAAFLACALWALARARAGPERPAWAACAGLFVMAAGLLRFEVWALIPPLALALWRRWRSLGLFLAPALVHPLLWLSENALEQGDPLGPLRFGARFEGELNARAALPLAVLAFDALRLVSYALRGLTLPLALLVVFGLWVTWRRRPEALAWLVPALILAILEVQAILAGALIPKPGYAILWTLFAAPFLAPALEALAARLHIQQARLAGAVLLVAGLVQAAALAGGGSPWTRLASLAPVPRFDGQEQITALAARIPEAPAADARGWILDAIGSQPQGWLMLSLDLRLRDVFRAPDTVVDTYAAEELEAFVARRPEGWLLLLPGSRFAAALGFRPEASCMAAGALRLAVRPTLIAPWGRPPLRPAAGSSPAPADLHLLSYRRDEGCSPGS